MIISDNLIRLVLKEDVGKRDLTTELLVPPDLRIKAKIIAKENGVIAGLEVAKRVFEIQNTKYGIRKMENGIKFWAKMQDGDKVKKSQIIAEIYGPARTILTAERVALNFLGHLSGIATLTRKYVDAVKPIPHSSFPIPHHPIPITRIYDTRKTTPLWRELEKYAVRCGGGYNHRMDLSEQILIKDNHLKAVHEFTSSRVHELRKKIPKNVKIEMEAQNLEQVKEALDAGVDIIMLDNMSFKEMKKAVRLVQCSMFPSARAQGEGNVQCGKRAEIEVSGGVNLKNVRKIAKLGVERISIGEITHSAPALDISLEVI